MKKLKNAIKKIAIMIIIATFFLAPIQTIAATFNGVYQITDTLLLNGRNWHTIGGSTIYCATARMGRSGR